jgi:aldehyde dehydrogenase (NAD+)
MGYIESGKEQGATLHAGGEQFGDGGYWIKPTIFTNTKSDMKIVREEIFGPVSVVIKFEDEEDVIRQANDTTFGLAASVFTENINRAMETAQKLQAGTVWVNHAHIVEASVPYGGYKQSGIGVDLGEDALAQFVSLHPLIKMPY